MANPKKITISKADLDLLNLSYLMISNTLINDAISIYFREKRSDVIPLSFVNFYIEEVKGYHNKRTSLLNNFFDAYNKDKEKYSVLPSIFAFSFNKLVVSYNSTSDDPYFVINKNLMPYPVLYNTSGNKTLGQTFENLNDIKEHFKNSDELVSIIELYNEYKKERKISEIKAEEEKAAIEAAMQKQKMDSYMVGKSVAVPTKDERVTRLFIPKYSLPTKYPTSFTKSRVNSLFVAESFMDPAKQVMLLSMHKFKSVSYSKFFIEKRIKILRQRPRNEINF